MAHHHCWEVTSNTRPFGCEAAYSARSVAKLAMVSPKRLTITIPIQPRSEYTMPGESARADSGRARRDRSNAHSRKIMTNAYIDPHTYMRTFHMVCMDSLCC